MKMSEQQRFTVGGLFGAMSIVVAGIFQQHFLLALALPGAFLGYHFDRVIATLKKDLGESITRWISLWNFIQRLANKPLLLTSKKVSVNLNWISRLGLVLLGGLLWCLLLPKKFYTWLEAHPLNRASFISGLVALLYATLVYNAWLSFAFDYLPGCIEDSNFKTKAITFHPTNILYLIFAFIAFLLTVPMPIMEVNYSKRLTRQNEHYFNELGRYQEKGVLFWVISDIKAILKNQVVYLISIITGITYIVAVGGSIVVFMFLPALIFVGLIHGINEAVVKHGGWTCAIVTTITTTISGVFFWEVIISNFTVSWLLALVTGLVAGRLSWWISLSCKKLCRRKSVQKLLAEETCCISGVGMITKPYTGFFPKGASYCFRPIENWF